jgi:2-methylcitrate synthase
MSVEVKKGLEGVIADESAVSKVMPESNSLTYRGYPVQDLAEHCRFEEVAYLLWHGELPTQAELDALVAAERGARELSAPLLSVIRQFPKTAHPMDTIRTAVSFRGMEDADTWAADRASNLAKSLDLLAKIPTMIAADFRLRKGSEPIAPRADLPISENFFWMCFGEVPHPEIVKAFDVSLILYAEHGFNASTFAARVVTSTMSDLYSAVVGGIGALKGPLHGGANEAVMYVLQEIGTPENARPWLDQALATKRKIMGFGHRVYKSGDSRVPTMTKHAIRCGEIKGEPKWQAISVELAAAMLEKKSIHPNLDFPSGPAYYLMGFDIDMFTPIFVMARITGWTAHILEQTAANRLIRPLTLYTGVPERKVLPVAQRG